MQLRHKLTGKVGKLLTVAYDSGGAIVLMVEIDGIRELFVYARLDALTENWEDYEEKPKPAITEDERKYLVAWLRLLNYTHYDSIKRDDKSKLQLMHGRQCISAIPTFGRFRWWEFGQTFTIEELDL